MENIDYDYLEYEDAISRLERILALIKCIHASVADEYNAVDPNQIEGALHEVILSESDVLNKLRENFDNLMQYMRREEQ